MKKLFALASSMLLLLLAAPVAAQTTFFEITSGNTVFSAFNLSGDPFTWDDGYATYYNVDYTVGPDRGYVGFYDLDSDVEGEVGGLTFSDGSGTFSGDQLYGGTEDSPTFTSGSYQIYGDLDNQPTAAYTVSITNVPEPATWLMMILGFGTVGVALRRKQRSSSLAVPVRGLVHA